MNELDRELFNFLLQAIPGLLRIEFEKKGYDSIPYNSLTFGGPKPKGNSWLDFGSFETACDYLIENDPDYYDDPFMNHTQWLLRWLKNTLLDAHYENRITHCAVMHYPTISEQGWLRLLELTKTTNLPNGYSKIVAFSLGNFQVFLEFTWNVILPSWWSEVKRKQTFAALKRYEYERELEARV